MRSTAPDFETKPAEVIGLYLDPRQHRRAVYRRENGDLGARPDRPVVAAAARARHAVAYAALDTYTGEVVGSAVSRHTSDEFVAFLESVIDTHERNVMGLSTTVR